MSSSMHRGTGFRHRKDGKDRGRGNSNKMIETMHTGTPYVELRTGAPHASVLVCVCAPFTTLQWNMKSWLFQSERFTVGLHFDNTLVKSCVFAWRDPHKWHCSVQSDSLVAILTISVTMIRGQSYSVFRVRNIITVHEAMDCSGFGTQKCSCLLIEWMYRLVHGSFSGPRKTNGR
jgi:hypothetical protein